MTKLLLISIDQTIKLYTEKYFNNPEYRLTIFNSTSEPLEVMSQVCSNNPTILILDDDFLNPNSNRLLSSIKNANPKLSVIFITSNTSLELGREINKIGVKSYLIKPISENNLNEYIKSVITQN